MRDPWISLREAAMVARKSERTVRRWVYQGKVRSRWHPLDRRVLLVRLADVQRTVDEA